MEHYKVLGQYSFYIDVQYDQPFCEKSNITINAFANRGSKIPIPCKYSWLRNQNQIDHQGNIYQCCAADVGCILEVHVTSFEDEYDGKAVIKFFPLGLSDSLEKILFSLLSDGQKVTVYTVSQVRFEFLQDRICMDNTIVQVRFPEFGLQASQDVKALTLKGNILSQFNVKQPELSLKFHSREDRDIFISCFLGVYALKHISYRTIIENIGQALQIRDSRQLFQWIMTHKVCHVTVNPIKVNLHNQDDTHLLRAQNQQLQTAVENLQVQLKKQQLQNTTISGYSEKLQSKNPPIINRQDLLGSPSSGGSIDKRYKDEIDQLQKYIERLKQQNSSERINQLQSQLDMLSQENTELKKRYVGFDSEQSKRHTQERNSVSDFQEFVPKKDSKEPLEKMVQSLQQELKTYFLKEKKLQGRIQELESQCSLLRSQQSQPNLLNQSLLRQSMLTVDDQQIKMLEEKIEEAKKFNNRLKDEIERQKRKIVSLQEENDYLKKINPNFSASQVSASEWKEKLHLLEKENRMLRERQLPSPSKANQQQLENLVSLNQKLVSENGDLQRKLRDLDDEINLIKNLSQSRIVCQTNDDYHRVQMEQLEKENQYLHKKVEILQRETSKAVVTEKNTEDKEKIKQLDAQLQKFKQQSQRYMEENIKLFDEIRQLKDQIDLQSVQDSRINNSVIENGLKVENDTLRQQVVELRNEINRMKSSHKANASHQGVSDDSVKFLKMELENEQLRHQLKELSSRQFSTTGTSSLVREKDEEIMLLQMQVQRLQQTNQRVMEQNTMLMEQVKKLQEELCSRSLSQSRIELSEIMEKPNYRGWAI